ncbi:unnamed protein product [Paramecium octaurelia]|uniref:FHA domain-containing protein n=1 Tax=Paramecium octaurelia TaxID=43137 RepID=A0A8S1SR13_PAROT|nr:unnamed protein product [Paramecium octaurelia]
MNNAKIVDQVDNAQINLFPTPPQIPTNQDDEIIDQLLKQDYQQQKENPQFDKYYQKRTSLINNTELNELEPYIKLTVGANSPTHLPVYYFINQQGLIGSPKTANSEDIIIGRSHVRQVNPLDIILQMKRLISKVHCKLICQDYFRQEFILKLIYTLVLYRIRTQSNFPLPQRARFIISQFLDQPRHVYIQDLGSLSGTSLQLKNTTPCIMKQDQMYSFGANYHFIVKFCQSFNEGGKDIDDQFFQLLKQLYILKKPKLRFYFGDPNMLQKLFNIIQQGSIEDSYNKTNQEQVYDKLKEYKVAIINIGLNQQRKRISFSQTLYFHLENEDSYEITIGRSNENSYKIRSDTISRKQCRFQYLKSLKAWGVFDGTKDNSSLNGTWIQLQTVQQMNKQEESNLIEVKNNAVFKVGSIQLKIEMIKGKQELKLFQSNINQTKTK